MFASLKVGIMGCGNIAEAMALTLKKAGGVTLYAVGSRTEEKAKAFAEKYPCKKVYGSYEELCADPKVQLIYIATPHSEHYANAHLALEHGKHVLCEKAFMMNEEEAKSIISYANERGLLICEALWPRFMPFVETIRETIASGAIGTPYLMTANLGYAVYDRERLRLPSLGGGVLLDIGIYTLNFASMFFGNDVVEISAAGTKNAEGADEQDVISLRYADGRVASLTCSMRVVTDRKGVIYGDKGYMVVENINNFESLTVYDTSYKKVLHKKRPRQLTGYEYEVLACKEAIREKKTECPQMPHSETLTLLRFMDAIRRQLS